MRLNYFNNIILDENGIEESFLNYSFALVEKCKFLKHVEVYLHQNVQVPFQINKKSQQKKRKRIGFYSRYLFYSLSLHAFQVSTQIDFLITQTYFTSFTTTKNGFDMTKEKLTAFLTTTLIFWATSFPNFLLSSF